MSTQLDLVPVKPTTAIVAEPETRKRSEWFRLLVNDRVADDGGRWLLRNKVELRTHIGELLKVRQTRAGSRTRASSSA